MKLLRAKMALFAVLCGTGLALYSELLCSSSGKQRLLCVVAGVIATVLVAVSSWRRDDRLVILAMALYALCFVLASISREHGSIATTGYGLLLFMLGECAYGAARRGVGLGWRALRERGRLGYLATVIVVTISVSALCFEFELKGRQNLGVEAAGVIGLVLVPVVIVSLALSSRRRDEASIPPRS